MEMYTKVQPHDIIQAVLQQEIALYCGKLIATRPDLFSGILKLRMGYVSCTFNHLSGSLTVFGY